MHVRTLSSVSNAQTGDAIDCRSEVGQIRSAKLVEVGLTGTATGITTTIEGSFDGSDWFAILAGSASDVYVKAETSAAFVRVVTSGTGGPYTADVFVGRLGQS